MIDITKSKLHENVYTKAEICKLLNVTEDELAQTSLSSNTLESKKEIVLFSLKKVKLIKFLVTEFDLYKRALHVFTEAKRVHDFKETCSLEPDVALKKLGELMNQSHDSCSNLYNCSCKELDELTELCRSAGAYGSRLTGAGWGGCAVSLIPSHILQSFLSRIKSDYYSKNANLEEKFQCAAFATKPSNGIQVIKLV